MSCAFSGEYHDAVWGTPVLDSPTLFAQLSLASQQAGVSWRLVWNKRHHFAEAFHGWDMRRVAAMGDAELDALCDPEGPWRGRIMQNRAKLGAIIHNARLCVEIDDEACGGLAGFLWAFVAGRDDTVNACVACEGEAYGATFGVESSYSRALAAELKRERGFKFVGSITLQAFLLQNGLLNGHGARCAKNPRCGGRAGWPRPAGWAAAGPPASPPASRKRARGAREPPGGAATAETGKRRGGRRPVATDAVFL